MGRIAVLALLCAGLSLFARNALTAQSQGVETFDLRFPGAEWLQYRDASEAGFSPNRLARARDFWERRDSPALIIVADGAVVAAWGEVDRRFPVHSIRKSLLSAVFGAHMEEIDLDATLAELGIQDRAQLTPVESGATLRDILTSSSGVYLPAVGETADAAAARPARGSRRPGDRWWYNNWDFNVAGTIFERATGTEVLSALSSSLASEIGMEDWRPGDGFYYSDGEVSVHAGFGARMSTRDLARFGWLYVAGGEWRGNTVVPRAWVEESTSALVEAALDPDLGTSYGYMWWVDEAGYYARGYGGHVVAIYPRERVVVVVRADTYHDRFLSNRSLRILLDRIREARVSEPVRSPELVPLEVDSSPEAAPGDESIWRPYLGEISLTHSGVTVRVAEVEGGPVLEYGEGLFDLRLISAGRFIAVDSRDTVTVHLTSDGRIQSILSEPIIYLEAAAAARKGEVDEAVEWVSLAVDEFPYSPGPRLNLARALLGIGDRAGARAQLDTASMLDSSHPDVPRMRRTLRPRWYFPVAGAVALLLIAVIVWNRRAAVAS